MIQAETCRRIVIVTFIVLVAIHNVALVQRRPAAELAIRLQTNVPTRIEFYFDTGRGFNKAKAFVQEIASADTPQQLFVPLPARRIGAIRLLPLQTSSTIQISEALVQKPGTQVLLHRFDVSRIVSESEAITGGAQSTFVCEPPLTVRYSADQILSARFFRVNGLWLLFGLLLFLAYHQRQRWWPSVSSLFQKIDSVFVAQSRRFARSAVLPLDRTALWYYAICLSVFTTMATVGLHGSSIRIYGSMFAYSPVKQLPLLGTPKGTRMDEWNYHTPAILNQVLRPDRLAADASQFGPDKAALFANVPTHHWSEWFRPQFWFFHRLPPALAYAFYWQAKAVLLLTGTFSLLLLLTRSSIAAILGALWYFFSTYTQWCYSWPSLLPEMVGLFGWVICLGAYLTVGQKPWWLAVAALLCTVFALNFALCAYPPHQFPLVILGLTIAAWWFWARADLIFCNKAWRARLIAVAGCGLSIILVMGFFYIDARTGFRELAHTVYPGQRSVGGGTVTAAQMISHFMDFWKSERHFPAALGNICEATGFLWLAPATLLLSRKSATTRQVKTPVLFLWLAFLLLATWMLIPIPATIGRILLLDKVIAHRCLPALGLINVAIVVLAVSRMRVRSTGPWLVDWRKELVLGLGILILLLAALGYMNSVYHHFFTSVEILFAAVYITCLVSCLRSGQKQFLAAALLLPTIATNALVNPVDRGFDVILKSSLSDMIQQRPELRRGQWLVYSSWIYLPGFFSACGLDLVNGLKIIPALEKLSRFDPEKKFAGVTNQSCHLVAHIGNELGTSEFENPAIGVVVWKVHPLDSRLKGIGVKYVAFDSQPDSAIRKELKLIFQQESGGIWAYELP